MIKLQSKYYSALEDFLIIFLFVFNFKIPVLRSSSFLLLIFLLLRFLFDKRYKYNTIKIINSRYVGYLLCSYITIALGIVFFTCIHLQFDFTLLPTIINITITLFISIFVVSSFVLKKRDLYYLLKVLIAVFSVQSLIELLAYSFEPVLNFVQLFQSQSSIEKAASFHGRRGLALAGPLFFGLSTLFGIIFLLIIKKWEYAKRISLLDFIIVLLIFVGGFFTGRTFFIGFGLGGVYFMFSNFRLIDKMKYLLKFLILIGVICLFIITLIQIISDELYKQLYNLIWYVFEALFNYIEKGELSTTSSDHLMDKMYFPVSLSTILFGDGVYTGPDGAYYMHTDAGYMRNILLFGIGGLFLLILSDIVLIWGNKELRNKEMSKFNVFVFIYLLIIHIKGEAIGYFISIHSILFLIYILYSFDNRLNERRIHKL